MGSRVPTWKDAEGHGVDISQRRKALVRDRCCTVANAFGESAQPEAGQAQNSQEETRKQLHQHVPVGAGCIQSGLEKSNEFKHESAAPHQK